MWDVSPVFTPTGLSVRSPVCPAPSRSVGALSPLDTPRRRFRPGGARWGNRLSVSRAGKDAVQRTARQSGWLVDRLSGGQTCPFSHGTRLGLGAPAMLRRHGQESRQTALPVKEVLRTPA